MFRTISRGYALGKSVSQNVPKTPKIPPTGMTLNPYAIFVKEKFGAKSGNNVAIVKELSAEWKKLSIAEKSEYKKKSETYRQEKIDEFLRLDEQTQKQKIEEAKDRKVEKAKRRERKEKREEWKATGHPQLPPNAYAIFIKEFVDGQKSSGTAVTELVKSGAQKWKQMTDSEKQTYVEKAKSLNDEYHAKLAQWKTEQKKNDSSADRKRSPSPQKH